MLTWMIAVFGSLVCCRVPGDSDAVNALKLQCDSWSTQLTCSDPCVPASLLKLWYRELHEPLVPFEYYDKCVTNHDNIDGALCIVAQLPQLNRSVLKYFIRFLQVVILTSRYVPTHLRCDGRFPSQPVLAISSQFSYWHG